ncbi:putative DNA helicase Pif1, P-loop containing nucleoside triphosphate hydrolase [Arabidopsis thaliana]
MLILLISAIEKLPGEQIQYLNTDSIDPSNTTSENNPVFTPVFLNSIKISSLPNQCLRLKIGVTVMLLRNLDPKGGLCNGTRLQITQMTPSILQAVIITGDRCCDIVLIRKILITPSDTKLP